MIHVERGWSPRHKLHATHATLGTFSRSFVRNLGVEDPPQALNKILGRRIQVCFCKLHDIQEVSD